MNALQEELQHLINLMADPWREYWAPYCWIKAKGLAQHDPETYRDLPRLLTEAMRDKATPTTLTETK